MTQEEFTREVLRVMCFPDPTLHRWSYGVEPRRTYNDAVAEMANRAEPSWLPLFFEMYTMPPERIDNIGDLGMEYSPELQEPYLEEWRATITMVLGSWVRREPSAVLPALATALESPEHRQFACEVLEVSYTATILPYLRPWLERFSELTDNEALPLVEALGNLANAWTAPLPEAKELLHRLQRTVPEARKSIHETIQMHLNHSND